MFMYECAPVHGIYMYMYVVVDTIPITKLPSCVRILSLVASVEYKMLDYPVVFSFGKAGVHRSFPKHKDPVLETRRIRSRTNAK